MTEHRRNLLRVLETLDLCRNPLGGSPAGVFNVLEAGAVQIAYLFTQRGPMQSHLNLLK